MRRQRTDPFKANLVKTLAEVGFEHSYISRFTDVPLGTVRDILSGRHGWDRMHFDPTMIELRTKQKRLLAYMSLGLVEQAIKRMEAQMSQASPVEAMTICSALMKLTF